MLTISTIRWCRRSVGESCELWEVLSEDVWQGKVRGYRLSATCVHFDARAKTAHSRSIQRQRRPGTSVAKSFAVRFAAGARLSVSVAFDSSVFALYLRYSTICSIYLASCMT